MALYVVLCILYLFFIFQCLCSYFMPFTVSVRIGVLQSERMSYFRFFQGDYITTKGETFHSQLKGGKAELHVVLLGLLCLMCI